jgi:hypothetical protein
MSRLCAVLLIVAGVIHLLPLPGVLGVPQLARLYGVDASDPNLAILLRHRAVLFGLLGAALLAAAFRPDWRLVASAVGLASAVAFLWIALAVGDYNAALQRVVVADAIAVLCLTVVAVVETRRLLAG